MNEVVSHGASFDASLPVVQLRFATQWSGIDTKTPAGGFICIECSNVFKFENGDLSQVKLLHSSGLCVLCSQAAKPDWNIFAEHSYPNRCEECHARFGRREHLVRHTMSSCPQWQRLRLERTCQECYSLFHDKPALAEHYIEHLEEVSPQISDLLDKLRSFNSKNDEIPEGICEDLAAIYVRERECMKESRVKEHLGQRAKLMQVECQDAIAQYIRGKELEIEVAHESRMKHVRKYRKVLEEEQRETTIEDESEFKESPISIPGQGIGSSPDVLSTA